MNAPASQSLAFVAAMPKILVIEDDPVLRGLLAEYLGQHGMGVVAVADSSTLQVQLERRPSLIILDLHLGREDGLDVLRAVRAACDVPVIIVTGHRREELDRIVGLELGADDYVTKPFGLRELLARVRSILRRRGAAPPAERLRDRGLARFAGWELDLRTRKIRREGEEPIALTKGQFALLHAFLEAPGRALTREHLLRATHVHEDVFDRSIDVQVLRLRRTLGAEGPPHIIETVRGVGYIFRAEVEAL